jgi:acetylornithine/succinyldiaminopimelate/putrescine aminotransferase
MPGVWHYDYNSQELVDAITQQTACVILETVQAEAGVIVPKGEWLKTVAAKCKATGTLLVLDEIQCGFGRTGKLWGFEHYGVVPDILLLGKALGGGMPLGAFISSQERMRSLSTNPVLGHITTFGGHPVCCAAGKASFELLLTSTLINEVASKEALLLGLLKSTKIKEVRSRGLLMAVHLDSGETVIKVLQRCLEHGLFSDWFLFAADCIRLAPPLTISEEEIKKACSILENSIEAAF